MYPEPGATSLSLKDIQEVVGPLGVPAFIVELTGDGYVLRFLNEAHLHQTDQSGDGAVDRPIEDTAPARLASLMVRNYDRCVREGRPIQYDEGLIFSRGISTWRTTLSPFFDENGAVRFLVGLSLEISEEKQREHDLVRKQSDLDYANEAIVRITSTVAHDLRAPLRKIALMADLISEDFQDLGDNKLNFINRTRDIAHDAIAYVDLIVNEAKAIENQPVEPESVDFEQMIAAVLSTLDPTEEYSVSVECGRLMAERVALEVIVRNLLDNAIKYGEHQISIKVEPSGEAFLALSIRDDGPGMSAELIEKVNGGKLVETGLGLRTVARLARSRGGHIHARAGDEGGCKITVVLPGKLDTQRDRGA